MRWLLNHDTSPHRLHRRFSRSWAVWCVLFVFLTSPQFTSAAPPEPAPLPAKAAGKPNAAPPGKGGGLLAVDQVLLKNGKTLRGMIVHRQPDGTVVLAVARPWLQKTYRDLANTTLERNLAQQHVAWTQTRQRLQALLEMPPADDDLRRFYERELARIEQRLEQPRTDPPEFLWLTYPAADIRQIIAAPRESAALAVIGWSEELPNVETLNVDALRQELTSRKIRLDGPVPDLSPLLPARPQSPREWSVRLAMLGYDRDPVHLQGTGDLFLRVEQNQPVDLSKLLQPLLKGQLQSLLGDLLGEPTNQGRSKSAAGTTNQDWWRPALPLADEAGTSAVRVTRLVLDAEQQQTRVESVLLHRPTDKPWSAVWKGQAQQSARTAHADIEARLAEDPQLKSALKLAQQAGLASPELTQQALRMGAATQLALEQVNGDFALFRNRATARLDGPPLFLE